MLVCIKLFIFTQINSVNKLQENESIELLNLMNNDIDAKGVLRFAKLGNYLNLTTLRLNGNPIGDRVSFLM